MAGPEQASVTDPDERVALTAGGIHVGKWVAEQGSTVPIVKYEIRSVRDDDVRVALTDRIPDHLSMEDVGFHDEYHGDNWQQTGAHEIRFEIEVPAGEALTTVYGVRQEAIEDPGSFLGRPEMSISSTPNTPDTADEASDAGASTDSNAVDAESTASDDADADRETAEQQTTGQEDDEIGTLSLVDPVGDDETVDDASASADVEDEAESSAPSDRAVPEAETGDSGSNAGENQDATDSEEASVTAAISETAALPSADDASDHDLDVSGDAELVDRFVDALQSDAVDADTRDALVRELNLQLSASSSQFVEHLQSRMKEKRSQLEAELENLEDSIAELYGLKADASTVAALQEEKADADRVTSLAAQKADAEDVEAVSARVDAVAEASATRDALATVREDLASVAAESATEDALAETRSDLDERVDAVVESVEAVEAQAATATALAALVRRVEDVADGTPALEDFESLRADHEALAAEAARESEVEALAADLESTASSVTAEVDALEELLSDRLDREVDRVDDALETKAAASALGETNDAVESLSAGKAEADRVAAVEHALEDRYVTEADISAALESRLRTSLLARTLLVAGGVSAGAGIALVGTGTTVGAALVVVALAAFGYWWWLNDTALDDDQPVLGPDGTTEGSTNATDGVNADGDDGTATPNDVTTNADDEADAEPVAGSDDAADAGPESADSEATNADDAEQVDIDSSTPVEPDDVDAGSSTPAEADAASDEPDDESTGD